MREQARIGLSARGLGLAGALFLVAAAIASSGLADGRAAVNGRSASSVLAGTWRRLPAAPARAPTALTVSVWTGRQMVIVGRAYPKPPQGIDVAAAYNPATNKWRRLAPLKGPVGNFQGRYHAVWTGKEMLVGARRLPGLRSAEQPLAASGARADGRRRRRPCWLDGQGDDRVGRRLLRRRALYRLGV